MADKTVGQAATLSGVSVRTLHHYDEIGLLGPLERSDSGYRLYAEEDLARLQEILLWRSLGFPLDEIRELLDDPDRDPLEALHLHRERLVTQVGEINARIGALDIVIAKRHAGEALEEFDLVALFDGFDPADFEEEAEQRWGDTEPWNESKRRTRNYGPKQWTAIKSEHDAVTERFAALLRNGVDPAGFEAIAAAQDHRLHIHRWFYDCSPEIHRGLGEVYVSDPRFKATYDEVEAGLADFISSAIRSLYAPREKRL